MFVIEVTVKCDQCGDWDGGVRAEAKVVGNKLELLEPELNDEWRRTFRGTFCSTICEALNATEKSKCDPTHDEA